MIRLNRRARALTAEPLGDGRWMVSGGTRPHVVDLEAPPGAMCDCEDARIRRTECMHALRARLAVLDGELLAGLLALTMGTQVPTRPEIARPGRSHGRESALERPAEPGLPLEAFRPPTRSRRRGARRGACEGCAA